MPLISQTKFHICNYIETFNEKWPFVTTFNLYVLIYTTGKGVISDL